MVKVDLDISHQERGENILRKPTRLTIKGFGFRLTLEEFEERPTPPTDEEFREEIRAGAEQLG